MRRAVQLFLLLVVLSHTARGQGRRRKGERDDNQIIINEGKSMILFKSL